MYRELAYSGNCLLVKGAVSAGTSDTQTFTEVDMAGLYTSLIFIAMIGTVTSTGVATMTAKNSATSATYGSGTVDSLTDPTSANVGLAAGVVSAVATTGDSNTLLILDLHRLPKRYVQGQIVRATANVVITGVVAIQYNASVKKVTQSNIAAAGSGFISNPVPSTT